MGKTFNALKWMKPEDSENLTKNRKDEQRTSLIGKLFLIVPNLIPSKKVVYVTSVVYHRNNS